MCQYCDKSQKKNIIINKSPNNKETQPNQAMIIQAQGDTPGIVLFRYGLAQGYFDINYCPICGRRLSEQEGLHGSVDN